MVKLFASEAMFKVTQHAMELHGGNGIMLDFGIEKLLRDASMYLHMDGTVDISRFKIVKAMFPRTAGITPAGKAEVESKRNPAERRSERSTKKRASPAPLVYHPPRFASPTHAVTRRASTFPDHLAPLAFSD